MRTASERAPFDNRSEGDPAGEARHRNFELLLACFKFKASIAKLSKTSSAQMSQASAPRGTPGYRPVGHRMARRIELGLGLPEFCMEHVDGVVPHLEDMVARCQAVGIEAALPGNAVVSRSPASVQLAPPRTSMASGLKPLHVATMESLEAALRRNALGDKECLELMRRWMPEG